MSQHTAVPKFGNWESDGTDGSETFPYTQIFEKARKGKSGGKRMNPNDPHDNPEAFHIDARPIHAPFKTSPDLEAIKPTDELHTSIGKDNNGRGGSPLHHGSSALSPHHVYGDQMTSGDTQRRVGRISDESDYRGNHSPQHLHPSYQENISAYDTLEGRSEGNHAFNSNSTGTLLMTAVQDDKIHKRGPAVPKFGEWDESNPYTADGYSVIFNQVREKKQKEEKHTEPTVAHNVSSAKTYDNVHESSHKSSGWWCFGWCKK
ncbi:RPM1-interacting protein 4 isoform X2 [Canna indica]|uniref:RPM1-interacting protein 4 isoform X2 n=1 Tax=Canna indica TaxID=4628 RepID=A0AAQ3K899_9LILI|nr:RPM1-interacting protein 4 isoform X2 [Canna indica]